MTFNCRYQTYFFYDNGGQLRERHTDTGTRHVRDGPVQRVSRVSWSTEYLHRRQCCQKYKTIATYSPCVEHATQVLRPKVFICRPSLVAVGIAPTCSTTPTHDHPKQK